jgi:hypothetical protein
MSISELEHFNDFKSSLSTNAHIYTPKDDAYEQARLSWNHDFTAKPSNIIWCATKEDVQNTVKFLAKHNLDFTVSGGRHSRFSVKEGVVQVNLGGLRNVRVDPEKKLAYVQGGCRNADLDAECSKYGLYTPAGTNPDTGVGGLISGGGFGYLSVTHGLSIDNLVNAELVTADGRIINANENENSDLFWGVRGAAFNFGIVTEFTLRVHHVGHVDRALTEADNGVIEKYSLPEQSALTDKVLGGMIIYPWPVAAQVFNSMNQLAYDESAPAHVMNASGISLTPHGLAVVRIMTYFGPNIYDGLRVLEPYRKLPTDIPPVADTIHPMSYPELQAMLDPLTPPGLYYERAVMVDMLSPEVIDILMTHAPKLPAGCEKTAVIIFGINTGKHLVKVDPDSTAFSPDARRSRFWIAAILNFTEESREAGFKWADELKELLRPHASGYYINNIGGDDPVTDLYPTHLNRLRALKTQYDPQNFFHNNNNILPL